MTNISLAISRVPIIHDNQLISQKKPRFNIPVNLKLVADELFNSDFTIKENLKNYKFTIEDTQLPFIYTKKQSHLITDIRLINHLVDIFVSSLDESVLNRFIYKTFTGEDIELLARNLNLDDEVEPHMYHFYEDKSFLTQRDLDNALNTIVFHLTETYLS